MSSCELEVVLFRLAKRRAMRKATSLGCFNLSNNLYSTYRLYRKCQCSTKKTHTSVWWRCVATLRTESRCFSTQSCDLRSHHRMVWKKNYLSIYESWKCKKPTSHDLGMHVRFASIKIWFFNQISTNARTKQHARPGIFTFVAPVVSKYRRNHHLHGHDLPSKCHVLIMKCEPFRKSSKIWYCHQPTT